jgi:PAS domain S-box-containing protein
VPSRVFGHAAGEAIGKRLDLIIPEHLRAAHWRGFDAALATGHTRLGGKPMLTRAVHKDGGKLYLELAFDVVRDASGAIVGSIATARMASKPQQR